MLVFKGVKVGNILQDAQNVLKLFKFVAWNDAFHSKRIVIDRVIKEFR
jgi:hypothetical protein